VRYAATSSVTGLEKSNVIGEQNFSSPIIPARAAARRNMLGRLRRACILIDPATGDEPTLYGCELLRHSAACATETIISFGRTSKAAQDFVLPI